MRNHTALRISPPLIGVLVLASALILSPFAMAEPVALGVSKAGIKIADPATREIPMEGATDSFTVHNITFNVWYLDQINTTAAGFDDGTDGAARRARLTETLTYVADVINISVSRTLDVVVELSLDSGAAFLASAGTFNPCADGFFGGSTLQRLTSGTKPFAGTEEIFVQVDFFFNWNEGTGAPAENQFDLLTVLLHEITHGLGLFSLTDSSGISRFEGPGCGSPFSTFTTWDSKVVTSENAVLWSGATPALQVNVSELTSDDLFFNGTNAVTGYDQGGTKPGVYAPGPLSNPPDNVFKLGSSISHWDTDNIVGGAVMEHAITIGTQQREYSAVDIGALIDIGYTNAAATGDPLDPDNVFVTFGGANGNGASMSPFNNLEDGLAAAAVSAIIHIAPGTSPETFSGVDKIDQAVTLVNTTGATDVVIGTGARRNSDDATRSGFVSQSRKE